MKKNARKRIERHKKAREASALCRQYRIPKVAPAMPEKTLIVWRYIDFAVRYWLCGETWLDFEVITIMGYRENPDTHKFDVPMYEKFDEVRCDVEAKTLDEAEVFCTGSIKWDGCSNIHYPAIEKCAQHLCGRDCWVKFSTLILRIFDTLAPMIPKLDRECAGFED